MDTAAIAAFDRTPRDVPRAPLPALYLGGFAGPFGWFFMGLGMCFVWIFTVNSNISDLWEFDGPKNESRGIVTVVHDTNFEIGGDEHSDGTPVFRLEAEFDDDFGHRRTVTSYTTGWQPTVGEEVTIDSLVADPDMAVIRGARRAPFGWFTGVVVLAFPLVGVGFAAWRLRHGRRAHRLLKRGRLAAATLTKKKATGTKINDRTVYKMTFEFDDTSGATQSVTIHSIDPEKLEDDAHEFLLHDADKPTRVVLMDNLPGTFRIDEHGRLASSGGTIPPLIIPILMIAANIVTATIVLS